MNNLHTYIQPQLDSMIDELISKGYELPELQKPLSDINNWYHMMPYDSVDIECDGLKGTFMNLLRMAELMTGSWTAFNLDLIQQVSITIEARWEIHMKHAQEDYMREYQHVLEVAV